MTPCTSAGRTALLEQYTAAFRQAEGGTRDQASASLKALSNAVTDHVAPDARSAIVTKIDAQIAKLA